MLVPNKSTNTWVRVVESNYYINFNMNFIDLNGTTLLMKFNLI